VEELKSLIGLTQVKSLVFEIFPIPRSKRNAEKAGLINERAVLHMVFKGNPGTGKTTIAASSGSCYSRQAYCRKGMSSKSSGPT
jgi:stage V sporulation protein K